jgi:RNA polymerase sigma-70 factor, ECF subfamily
MGATTSVRCDMLSARPVGSEADGVPEARPAQRNGLALLGAEFDRLYGLVYRFLLHRVFDRELAEELTAQTFYKSAAGLARLGDDIQHVQAWVLRVAMHTANTHYRRQRLRQIFLGRFARSRSVSAEPADPQRMDRVRAALLALPPKHQSVVVLRYYVQLSFDDIAAVLGCRPDAARARLSRALRELRQRLGLGPDVQPVEA